MDLEKLTANLPPEAKMALESNAYLAIDNLNIGDKSPLLTLTRKDEGGTVTLGLSLAVRPVVLIFGSYT